MRMIRDVRRCGGGSRRRGCTASNTEPEPVSAPNSTKGPAAVPTARAAAPVAEPVQAYVPIEEDPDHRQGQGGGGGICGVAAKFFLPAVDDAL